MEVEEIDLSSLDIKDNNDRKRNHSEVSASLEFDCDTSQQNTQPRRSGRKKIRPLEILEKRRVITRPRKLNSNSNIKAVESYYLDKKVKLSSPALETIFEEPQKNVIMSSRKLRRCIHFGDVINEKPDKNKVKKRSMKAKKVLKSGFRKIGKKLGLEMLMSKLKDLEDIDNVPN